MRVTWSGAIALTAALGLQAASGASGDCRADPTARIAHILLDFRHVCTPAQCQTLDELAADSGVRADERFLARALRRVVHRPHPADRGELQRLSASSPDDTVRLLARTLHGMTHVLTAGERARLTPLVVDDQACAHAAVEDPACANAGS